MPVVSLRIGKEEEAILAAYDGNRSEYIRTLLRQGPLHQKLDTILATLERIEAKLGPDSESKHPNPNDKPGGG